MLSSLGLTSFFEALIIGAECERAKPHPEPYLQGLAALGMSSAEAAAMELSMGMSGDFELAIEAGSSSVRVGSAIFGARAPKVPS